jgi:hypothetical protein
VTLPGPDPETDLRERRADLREHSNSSSSAGEREIKQALRQTLLNYRLHQDQELFERAHAYVRQDY